MPNSEIKEILVSLAEEIREAGKRWKQEAAKSWPSNSEADKDMRRCAAADAKAIGEVAKLVKAGQVFSAHGKADSLDTIVREAIPDKFWRLVGQLVPLR